MGTKTPEPNTADERRPRRTRIFHFTLPPAAYFFPFSGHCSRTSFFRQVQRFVSFDQCTASARALAFMGAPRISASWWLFRGVAVISDRFGRHHPASRPTSGPFRQSNPHCDQVYQCSIFSINFGAFSPVLTREVLQNTDPTGRSVFRRFV